jgi:hypothetical protein
MVRSGVRKKKMLLESNRVKTSRTITARYEYDMDDEALKFPDHEVGMLGNLEHIQKVNLSRELEGQLEGMHRQDIPTRAMEKKQPAFRNGRKATRQQEEVDPLALAQIRQGQVPRLSHPHEASMEVETLARSSDLRTIPRKKDQTSLRSYGQRTSKLLGQNEDFQKVIELRRYGMPHLMSHYLQSDKPRAQSITQGIKQFTSKATTALKNTFSSQSAKSASSSLSSKKRGLEAMHTRVSKVEDVVDLCSDDDRGHDHGENDGESTATEHSAVTSSSRSKSTGSVDTSRASVVASAFAASPSRNSQDSGFSDEDLERLTASAQGPSRPAERLAWKEAGDLYPGNSPEEKSGSNVCHILDDISEGIHNASLNENSRKSTTPKSQSRTDDSDLGSSRKKARTEATPKDSPGVNWGGPALPKQPKSGDSRLSLTKANGMCLQHCDWSAWLVSSF